MHAPYLVATGVWSLAHRRSFERVTGPKEDYWLCKRSGRWQSPSAPRSTLPRVYFADALLEIAFLAAWLEPVLKRSQSRLAEAGA
jgi:hypothetical protein